MIAYMPGTISSGVSNEATHAVDFYKTYAALANIALPDPAVHPLDGESLAAILTVRATGEPVPPPQHSPVIEFSLGSDELGVGLAGTTEGLVSSLGVSMNLTAEGSNGVFDADNNGIGISSDLDTGGNNTQRRIDGSLTIPEGMVFSFNQDVNQNGEVDFLDISPFIAILAS